MKHAARLRKLEQQLPHRGLDVAAILGETFAGEFSRAEAGATWAARLMARYGPSECSVWAAILAGDVCPGLSVARAHGTLPPHPVGFGADNTTSGRK